jgi:hypothetical protein
MPIPIAQIYNIDLSQGVAAGGAAFDYTITVYYTDSAANTYPRPLPSARPLLHLTDRACFALSRAF